MCLILLAHRVRRDAPLVVAANRDEFYDRPTRAADYWTADGYPDLLAGKDLRAGGTWLGITRCGRFAAVTNYRAPPAAKPRSRGALTRDFLIGNHSAREHCERTAAHYDDCGPFNLLVSDGEELYYQNNRERRYRLLPPGIYGLSNGLLDSPWPKVEKGRERLRQLLESSTLPSVDKLVALMADRQPAAIEQLPDTGLPPDLERILSSAFIHNPERGYGTTCSTGLMVTQEKIQFSERTFLGDGQTSGGSYHKWKFGDGRNPLPQAP